MVLPGCLRATEQAGNLPAAWLAYLSQNHYVAASLDRTSPHEAAITALINGQPVLLTIDTGAARTALSTAAARRLHLDIRESDQPGWGVGGAIGGSLGSAKIENFQLGSYEINRRNTICILPESARLPHDGVLGLDALYLNAMILPVGGDRLLFKPGPTPAVAGDAYLSAAGYRPAAFLQVGYLLLAAGHLNGQPLRAVLDCGAASSSIDLNFIRKAFGPQAIASAAPVEGSDSRAIGVYSFMPQEFDLGGIAIPPVKILALPSPVFAQHDFDAFFGYDLMALHQGILDLSQHKLWLK